MYKGKQRALLKIWPNYSRKLATLLSDWMAWRWHGWHAGRGIQLVFSLVGV